MQPAIQKLESRSECGRKIENDPNSPPKSRRLMNPQSPDPDHDQGSRVGAWAAAAALVIAVVLASGTVG
jgi:hypothetical protein